VTGYVRTVDTQRFVKDLDMFLIGIENDHIASGTNGIFSFEQEYPVEFFQKYSEKSLCDLHKDFDFYKIEISSFGIT